MNNTAYEFGGQSLGAALSSRFRLSDRSARRRGVDADGILLGGPSTRSTRSSPWSPIEERVREYDYGPGLGDDRAGWTLVGPATRC